MFGRPALLALLVAAALPATASAATISFTGPPGEGEWVKTRDVTVQFTGADAAECAVDGGAFAACGGSVSATNLTDGAHSVTVRVGAETAKRSFKVDATAPVATFGDWPAEGGVVKPSDSVFGPIYLASSSINFSAVDDHLAARDCRLDDAAFVPCAGFRTLVCVANGPHTLEVRLKDEAGNVTLATRHFALAGWMPNPSCPVLPPPQEPDLSDTAAPFVTFTGGIAAGAWSRERDVTLEFSAGGAECAADDGAFAPCDGSFTASALADGTHRISVRAGGQTAVRRFRVDATAPDVFIGASPSEGQILAPSDPIYPTYATGWGNGLIAFSPVEANPATTECRFDDAPFGACTKSYAHSFGCMPNGTHRFELRLTDKAGNVTRATRTITLRDLGRDPACPAEAEPDLSDTPAPTVTFTGGIAPGAWSRERDVTVSFTAAGAECAADDAVFTPCDGTFTATALADGTHRISVRSGGQTAVRRFRVDATAPNVAFGSPNEGQVIKPSEGIQGPISLGGIGATFRASDLALAKLECRGDDEPFGACSASWAHDLDCPGNGAHSVTLRVTDKAGNVTVATRSFVLRGWSFNPRCPLPVEPKPDLSDTPAPTVSFTGGIAAGAWSTARDVTVAFSAAAAECAVDDGAFTACDGSFTASGLADGTHSVSVRSGGQTAVRRFRVDATAPAIWIGYWRPEGEVIAGSGVMQRDKVFYTEPLDFDVATLQCRFDAAAFAPCDVPPYAVDFHCLPNGTHKLEAKATDWAGNATTMVRTFTLSGWTLAAECGGEHPQDRGPDIDPHTPLDPAPAPRPAPPAGKPAVPHVVLSSQHTKRWTKLRKLKLMDAPKGAKVSVSCKGCGGKRVRKLSDLTGRKLKPGTRVTVKVAARTITIKIRANRAPLIV